MRSERKSRRDRISIRGRLFRGFALFALLILLLLWLCQVVFLEQIYKSVKTGEIRSASRQLISRITDKEIGYEDLDDIADDIAEDKSVCILILLIGDKNDVKTMVSAGSVDRCLIHNPNIAPASFFELYRYVSDRGGEALQHYRYDFKRQVYYATGTEVFDSSGDEESIVYSRILDDPLGNRIMVMLNSVISPLDATVNTLTYLLIFITVFVILASILLAFFLSTRLSRPLVALNNKAKALAGSDYTIDFTERGYREISELSDTLNKAEAELSKVDKLKSELIANISHDLRTPLTLISGYAEVMRDIPGEATPENFDIIIDEAGRLTSFVNQMLDLSRLQSGTAEMNPSVFSITTCLYEALERYNKMLGKEQVRILFEADGDATVFVDRVRFEQAFYNLLNNAITHMGKDKTVTVRQTVLPPEEGGQFVRISVIDTGEGIPKEQLPYIWDRYYKVDQVHKRAKLGSGLGLSIVKTVMEGMHGRYGVESTPGVGSCFMLEVPMLQTKDENA